MSWIKGTNTMEKGFYHPNQGYWQTISEPSQEVLDAYPEGTVEVPLKPGVGYTLVDGVWVDPPPVDTTVVLSKEIRDKRDWLLVTEVDPIASNSLRWSSLSADQQKAWADYRQALLDVPQQDSFPHSVVWPDKPTA